MTDDVRPDGGPALFRLVRFWSRRWVNRASAGLTAEDRQVQHILAVEAVDTTRDRPGGATIGAVAHQLGLDHSGASRIVRDATAAGHLERGQAEHDGRRAALRLTEQGRALLEASHRWQRHTFNELTADWDGADRRRFATYLQRLADEMGTEQDRGQY